MTDSNNRDEVLFENDNYEVVVADNIHVENHGAIYSVGYAVTNKDTGVDEVFTNTLPDAIGAAEQLDLAMENEVWKWMRINQEADDLEKKEVH